MIKTAEKWILLFRKGVPMKAVGIRNKREFTIELRKALNDLKTAKAELECARRWGIVDICGGGILVTMLKQSKMEDAVGHIRMAMRHLQKFRRENDLTDYVHQDFLQLGEFAASSDYLLDNPISDIYVQAKINSLRIRVTEAIISMEFLMGEDPDGGIAS